MFREGQQIGLYTLIRKLGRGGFGEVWLAERKSKFVTTKVAVKLPLDEQVDHEAIKQEATLWEQASGHPNILPIIDADEYSGQIVIVSEYAPDGSLDEWLKTHGKMSVERAVETTIKILDGLEFLHSRNIIHRDLKPANILLQGDMPRLADFGISRALRTTASSQSSNVSGTFAYMPPEGFDGKRSVQTDIWSVGVNLYQFLTGNLPYSQKEPSALIAAIMMRDFEPLPSNVPQNLRNVISKALAKQPENRYKTAKEMREDLREVLRRESVFSAVQPDLQKIQHFASNDLPPITQKNAPISAQHTFNENETIVRLALSSVQSDNQENSNVWIYVTLTLVLICTISFGAYFLMNQSNRNDSNRNDSKKNELAQISGLQPSNNSTNYESINAGMNSIANMSTPTPMPTINKIDAQKMMNQYISNSLKKEELEDDVKQRKFVYGDLDNDGDEDAAVEVNWVFSTGGNGYGTILFAFRNEDGNFKIIDAEGVGGKLSRNFNLSGIKSQKIYGNIETCLDSSIQIGLCGQDGLSKIKKGRTQYSLQGNKLIER